MERRRARDTRATGGRGGEGRGRRLVALALTCAALLLGGCGQSPKSLAIRYLADLQQFNYPACYATLTDRDRAARTLKQFLTEIPLAPEADPLWFRAILFSTRYEVGLPQVSGERAVVPVKVTLPDLALWERTIDAAATSQQSPNAVADQSLQTGKYPRLTFDDALVLVKERHRWRVLGGFARRDLILDQHREALGIFHSGDYPKAVAAYQTLIARLGKDDFSGSRGLKFFFGRELKAIQNIEAQIPATRAYADKLVLSDVAVKMSEARVPALFGRITNAGDRGVDDVRVTVTWYGNGRAAARTAVYQESHSVVVTPIEFTGFIRPVLPFVPGETRDFGFELVAPPPIQQHSEPRLTVSEIVFTQSKAPLPKAPAPSPTPSARRSPTPSPRPTALPSPGGAPARKKSPP